VFGWYAAFLFLRTGHLAAAVAAHALCNALGFPAFGAIASHPRAGFIAAAFCAGVALFAALLMPLTDPALYGNALGGDSSRYLALASSLLHKHA
jgi:prenyl protein peptidase